MVWESVFYLDGDSVYTDLLYVPVSQSASVLMMFSDAGELFRLEGSLPDIVFGPAPGLLRGSTRFGLDLTEVDLDLRFPGNDPDYSRGWLWRLGLFDINFRLGWPGFDIRFGSGGVLNGGVSVGRQKNVNCVVIDSPEAGRPGFC